MQRVYSPLKSCSSRNVSDNSSRHVIFASHRYFSVTPIRYLITRRPI